jgi:hypothetical protein
MVSRSGESDNFPTQGLIPSPVSRKLAGMETQQQTPIAMVPVQSQAIAAIGYHPQSRILRVQMKDSDGKPAKSYDYPGVPADEADEFMNRPFAGSLGKHLAKHIRPRYGLNKAK